MVFLQSKNISNLIRFLFPAQQHTQYTGYWLKKKRCLEINDFFSVEISFNQFESRFESNKNFKPSSNALATQFKNDEKAFECIPKSHQFVSLICILLDFHGFSWTNQIDSTVFVGETSLWMDVRACVFFFQLL